MKMFIVAIGACIFSTIVSYARLGENIDECKARYGAWTSFNTINEKRSRAEFSAAIMDVDIIFYEGICESITYRRREGIHKSVVFSDAEYEVLKNINTEGVEWVKENDLYGILLDKWRTSSGSHYATRTCADKGTLFRNGIPINDTTFCEVTIMTAIAIEHNEQDREQERLNTKARNENDAMQYLKGY